MDQLEPPDTFYVSAAIGWLELGNAKEARAELEQVSAPSRQHPGVLSVHWQIHALAEQWNDAYEVAQTLVGVAPGEPHGWLHRAYAARRKSEGSLQLAWDALFPAAEKFPKESIISFNLACYACQMGSPLDALRWLKKAMVVGDADEIRSMALGDRDLEPLWDQIRKL